MSLVMFSDWVKVSYHHLSLPGSHYNVCVSYFGKVEVWQKFFFIFQFIVTIIFILVVLSSDMLLCLSLCTLYVLYSNVFA